MFGGGLLSILRLGGKEGENRPDLRNLSPPLSLKQIQVLR